MKKLTLFAFLLFMLIISSNCLGTESKATQSSISLDFVLKEGQNKNKDLNILKYTWEMWNYQILDMDNQITDLAKTVPISGGYLPVSREYFIATIPNYDDLTEEERIEVDKMIDIQIQINSTINSVMDANADSQNVVQNDQIDDQKKKLEETIYQLEINQQKNKIQEDEMIIGIDLMLTTQYVNLLIYKEQIDLLQVELNTLDKEIDKLNRYFKFGLVSKEDIYKLESEKLSKQKEKDKYNRIYQNELTKLLLELEIPLDLNIDLEPIPIKSEFIVQVQKPTNYDYLINNLYSYKLANKDLEWYEYLNNQVDSTSINLKKQQEYNLKIANEEILKLKDDLYVKVDDLYRIIDDAYSDYLVAIDYYNNSSYEYRKKKKEYDLGLVSKYELNNYQSKKDYAEINVDIAELNYYLADEQIKSMKLGYIR